MLCTMMAPRGKKKQISFFSLFMANFCGAFRGTLADYSPSRKNRDVMKHPKSDSDKISLPGILDVVRNEQGVSPGLTHFGCG